MKQDDFVPDERTVYYQEDAGYSPHFYFKEGKLLSSGSATSGSFAGIVYAYAYSAAAATSAHFGLRLSLKTRDRAKEFGKVFIETFNELI